MIELEERIATAGESSHRGSLGQALREAIARVKSEYDALVKQEESRAPGRWSHVITKA